MSRNSDRFADELRRAWGRPQLSATDRVAFDAALRQRLRPQRYRWAPWTLAAAVAAGAAAAVLLLPEEGDRSPAVWLDTLANGGVVSLEDASGADGLPVYGFDEAEGDNWLLANLLGDSDAGASGESFTSPFGYDYEVLAFWLAPENDGNTADSAQGGAGSVQDVP